MIRRGVPFNDDDERVLKALKQELEPLHGELSPTAIVRKSMRHMLQDVAQQAAQTPQYLNSK